MKPLLWLLLGLTALLLIAWWARNASRVGPPEACLSSCALEIGDQSLPGAARLKFLDLNMLHGFPRFERLPERVELIAAEIRRLDPDIACLQEVPWTRRTGSVARQLARQSRMNYAYLPVNGNRKAIFFSEGEAILSRFPIRELSFHELAPRPGPFEHRAVLHAAIQLPGMAGPGGQVHVFCTHLTNGEARINQGQSAALQGYVAAYPQGLAIIAGDFNAREGSPQVAGFSRRWVDAFRAAHPGEAGLTCCVDPLAGEGTPGPEERIDYVFLRPGGMDIAAQAAQPAGSVKPAQPVEPAPPAQPAQGLRIVESRIVFDRPFASPGTGLAGPLWASDHLGLLVEIEVDW